MGSLYHYFNLALSIAKLPLKLHNEMNQNTLFFHFLPNVVLASELYLSITHIPTRDAEVYQGPPPRHEASQTHLTTFSHAIISIYTNIELIVLLVFIFILFF